MQLSADQCITEELLLVTNTGHHHKASVEDVPTVYHKMYEI